MKKFNVLDRNLHIHQNFLLEASAGTGKTFSIQNIVVRLLIQAPNNNQEPLTIDQILVVTFTRAATRDLRTRIRSNIEQILHYIEEWQHTKILAPTAPDYLLSLLELGEPTSNIAKKRLQQALFSFDQAQIFTIHSFCSRMLKQYAIECDIGFDSHQFEESLPTSEVMHVIKDFFRTEIRLPSYSVHQLAIILKEDPEQKKLLKAIQTSYDFVDIPHFSHLHVQFCEQMNKLKNTFRLNSKALIEDFKAQYESFRNYKASESKPETLAKAVQFASLFDQENWSYSDFDNLIEDGLVWIHALDPTLFKSRATAPKELNFPEFRNQLQEKLEPIISLAGSFPALLARLSKDCKQMFLRYQKEEEKMNPDDLLQQMDWALTHHQPFANQIRSTYQAAIIDEFQDTDPTQWRIFQHLFLNVSWKGFIYLVGDPKQSIYSFRQADIYTYLEAAKALGETACYSLDTNYRSQPSLVQALNTIFDAEHVPHLIPLPKKDFYVPYQSVNSVTSNTPLSFQDARGAIHFFMADGKVFKKPTIKLLESEIFFPFIAQEIESLIEKSALEYPQIAVLVRDRYQAFGLAKYFDERKIPYVNQRSTSLVQSPALSALVELLHAILHPHNLGALKTALGGPLIGRNYQDFFGEPSQHELLLIQKLRTKLIEEGFPFFFQDFLQSSWMPDGHTVKEHLIGREGGIEFYNDLQQIADIIADHQNKGWNGPEGLIPFLDQFHKWETNDDARIKRFQDPSKNGVKILTLHVSKGLEFDVVFALGLISRPSTNEDLIPIENENGMFLTPLIGKRENYQKHFEENDAEKMRQLYVALTRAKYRLYIPVALSVTTTDLEMGEASPMDLFLARLGQDPAGYSELYRRIKNYDRQILIQFLESIGKRNHITYSIHEKIEEDDPRSIIENIRNQQDLVFPKTITVGGKSLIVTSFTSLSEHSPLIESSIEKEIAPHDYSPVDKSVHTLPAGNETGLLLHAILEKISFESFKELHQSQSISLVQPFLQQSKIKSWDVSINTIIYNALKTPITIEEDSFCLADIPSNQMYREMPFLFPYESSLAIEGMHMEEGFIKGVIDLIFCHGDKYYIVDWKSNWLGSSYENYENKFLHQAMLENNYFLQASLYKQALERYLKLVDNRPFKECFGGTIYVFLRGLQQGLKTGLYNIK